MDIQSYHYYGSPWSSVINLHGEGRALSSLLWPSDIIIIMDDRGVGYYRAWPWSILLMITIVIIMVGQGALLVWIAKSTMIIMGGQWLLSLLWMAKEFYIMDGQRI